MHDLGCSLDTFMLRFFPPSKFALFSSSNAIRSQRGNALLVCLFLIGLVGCILVFYFGHRALSPSPDTSDDGASSPLSSAIEETPTEVAATDNPDAEQVFIPVAGRHFGARFSSSMEGSPRFDSIVIFDEVIDVLMPQSVVEFDAWLARYFQSPPEARASLEAEGEALARLRYAALEKLLPESPQAVLLAALTPAEREMLPPSWSPFLETWVAGAGGYDVQPMDTDLGVYDSPAKNKHPQVPVLLQDRAWSGCVYGSRLGRGMETDASLFGVAIGDLLAVHEGDFAFFPSEAVDFQRAEEIAVLYRGQWFFISDLTELHPLLQQLSPSAPAQLPEKKHPEEDHPVSDSPVIE